MFDFVRKDALFAALDEGLPKKLNAAAPFHMKTVQDCIVYDYLKDANDLDIAEIGGGDSRLLRVLAPRNRCVNIEPFEGADGGPKKAVSIRGVKNITSMLGDFDPEIKDASFDVVFSISVVEHINLKLLDNFFEDGLRILRPGGLWLHAIDAYIGSEPDRAAQAHIDVYRKWAASPDKTKPVGAVFKGPAIFTADMASNPDDVMHSWGKVAPKLTERRMNMQGVSVIVASRKA